MADCMAEKGQADYYQRFKKEEDKMPPCFELNSRIFDTLACSRYTQKYNAHPHFADLILIRDKI